MPEILLLSREEIAGLLSLKESIEVVENAFSEFASGRAVLPPAIGFPIKEHDGEMHIKSGYMAAPNTVAVKIASSFKKNSEKGLPTVLATILAFDSSTGQIKAVMDGIHITLIRTAAAGAVAAKHLSKKDSTRVGIIGSGVQARFQLKALLEVRSIKTVKVYSNNQPQLQEYVKEMNGLKGLEVKAASSAKEACEDVDILVTCTPSHEPIVKASWISKGTHINAIGSDNPKKQELFADVLKNADKIVADRLEQCQAAGEIHHALKEGAITEQNIFAELGEITSGKKKGRDAPEETTIFDSTGVAVQDISVTALVLQKANNEKAGKRISL